MLLKRFRFVDLFTDYSTCVDEHLYACQMHFYKQPRLAKWLNRMSKKENFKCPTKLYIQM